MGLARDTSAGGNVWQLDKDLGADEDDGSFMEASPLEESQAADDDEVISFPVRKTASAGVHLAPRPDLLATVHCCVSSDYTTFVCP